MELSGIILQAAADVAGIADIATLVSNFGVIGLGVYMWNYFDRDKQRIQKENEDKDKRIKELNDAHDKAVRALNEEFRQHIKYSVDKYQSAMQRNNEVLAEFKTHVQRTNDLIAQLTDFTKLMDKINNHG